MKSEKEIKEILNKYSLSICLEWLPKYLEVNPSKVKKINEETKILESEVNPILHYEIRKVCKKFKNI